MRRVLLCVLAVVLFAAVAMAKDPFPGEPYYEYVRGEVLVKMKAESGAARLDELCSVVGGQVAQHYTELDFYRVTLPQTGGEAAAVKLLRAQPDVEWVNFNYIAHAFYTPNDTYYPYQWHYPRITMPSAWDITRGSSSVTVAVVDQGFYMNHSELAGVAISSPHDYVDNDNDPSTTIYYSHGAHVSGTIFAATNNNSGVAGIAPLCTFMPVRALDDSGSGSIANISSGISWATTHGADVMNLSLGFHVTGQPTDPGPPLSTAIAAAASAGVVVCAASGNDGAVYVGYPAAYTSCIAVGATGYDDAIAPYSNHGTELDVTAPGGNMDQDLNNDGQPDGVLSVSRNEQGETYIWMQGTSMASPHVAGVAALLLSNGLPSNQVRQALQETAQDLGTPGWDATYGWGRINAVAALQWHQGGGGGNMLLNESFDATFPPADWQLYQGGASGPGWQTLAGNPNAAGGTTTHSGANAAFHNDDVVAFGDSVRDWLITAPVQIPSNATAAQISFWQRNYYMDPQFYGLHALLSSTDGENFSLVQSYSANQPGWVQMTMNTNSLIGHQVWFAFYYVGNNGSEWYIDDVSITVTTPTSAGDRAPVVKLLTLGNPYPNPFNSTVVVPLELSDPARVELTVFNTLGQRITTLLPSSQLNAGTHRFMWNAEGTASGIYFIKLSGSSGVQTKQLMLVK